jgi:1-acyl-sn-glycerol-3-phosphate acyltransferase
MLSFLPGPILIIITFFLAAISTIFWALLVYIFAIGLIIPNKAWRKTMHKFLNKFPVYWIDCNKAIMWLTTKITWDVTGLENLKKDDWYLVISNHQSWVDILVLFKIFNRKIPILKFFMKQELLWQIPFAAQVCWLLDYPFMKRYSREYLKKHPEKKGVDIETTKKSCEKFKYRPTSIINFVEGGRFSEVKHQKQNSPYKFLLKPKAMGIAFTLQMMKGFMRKILNVTIIYPPGIKPTFGNFLTNKINKITLHIEEIPVTANLLGDYEKDREFRAQFQDWLNQVWRAKDKLIAKELGVKKSIEYKINLSHAAND